MMPKKILYIHHGHARGGAFLSLLYLLRSLDRTIYEPIVCNGGDEQDKQVEAIFSAEGFSTCSCRLPRFAHTTGGGYSFLSIKSLRKFFDWTTYYSHAKNNFKQLLYSLNPDVVHFNSLTLAPYACVPKQMGIPTVVHIRESVLDGIFGLRKRWLTEHLAKYADKVIAICKDNFDRFALPPGKAEIIYNPVDFTTFDFRIDGKCSRNNLGIQPNAKVVLFAGGSVWEAKGLFEFLEAMSIVKKRIPHLVCLMPSFQLPPDPAERLWSFKRRVAWLLGMFRKTDRLYRLVINNALDSCIIHNDFVYDIERWIAASDIVCVPHIQPHFSRTIMEAGAMKKPVAVFKVGGVAEVVQHEGTGLMVDRGDVSALARVMIVLLEDKVLSTRLGEGGYIQATQLFNTHNIAVSVTRIYHELVGNDN